MQAILLVDIGSTFTKLVALDLDDERILGEAKSPSTVETDVTIGMQRALDSLNKTIGGKISFKSKLGCSSAAGGLRMAVIGLVPDLTTEAAKRAALGAGAKVIRVFSYKLTKNEIVDLERNSPDIILLAGGTDGGNKETILYNARTIAKSKLKVPIIVAGNKEVSDDVEAILLSNKKDVKVVENVMPEFGQINVENARSMIRQLFIEKIIESKGLRKAESLLDSIIMPTPTSVLNAAKLLSNGGMGDLIIVDVGGATTDVHSIGKGSSHKSEVVLKGLPEPYAKRTVEGDLGIRYNAQSIMEVGKEYLIKEIVYFGGSGINYEERVKSLSQNISFLPRSDEDIALDHSLAAIAVEVAMERHTGKYEIVYTPHGQVCLQYGKDLTEFKHVIGTGGIFAYGKNPKGILRKAVYSNEKPFLLSPKYPTFYVDRNYILYAIGLLAEVDKGKAYRIGKKYLTRVGEEVTSTE